MSNFLTSQDCGASCQEEAEFSLKFVIQNFQLFDDDNSRGFDNILLVITFDGNVFKIDDFSEDEEGEVKPNGRELIFQQSPEQFSQKLGSVPIMFNLSRACDELGTVKLNISKCFSDAVKCEEFSSETSTFDLSFVMNESENATMTLVMQVVRVDGDVASQSLTKSLIKKSNKAKKTKATERKASTVNQVDETLSSSITDASTSSFNCETDLCPTDEKSPSDVSRLSSFEPKSINYSDNFDIDDFFTQQKRIREKRDGLSASTCSNIEVSRNLLKSAITVGSTKVPRTPHKTSVTSKSVDIKCEASVKRICSECFDDISLIPRNARCPNCFQHEQLHRKLVSLKSPAIKNQQNGEIRNCIKSLFEDIFMETRNELVNDWKRLKRSKKNPKKSDCCKRSSNQNKRNKMSLKSLPRCSKVKNLRTKRRRSRNKSVGLRKKHPGVVIGHRMCNESSLLVPKNMGWLWNVGISGLSPFRRGWRPGAIKKTVASIMKDYLTPPAEPAPLELKANPPTLRVQKKDGELTIIMNPLQDELKGIENSSPIVFKVVKSDDAKKRSIARKMLKTQGIEKSCDCNAIDTCPCLTTCDKAHIMFELHKMSTRLCLEPELNFSDLNDSSESEVDVEFTPKLAKKLENSMFECNPSKKSTACTQYEKQEEAEDFTHHDDDHRGEETFKIKHEAVKVKKTVESDARIKSKTYNKSEAKAHLKSQNDTKSKSRLKSEDNSISDVPLKFKSRNKRKKQVVLMMKDLPQPNSCNRSEKVNCNSICQPDLNFCLTTNYNPPYGQCPLQPFVCRNSRYMPIEIFHPACN